MPRDEQPKRSRRRPELFTRILVAIPLAIATIIFNNLGGLPFALFIIAAGLICMHELYGLLAIWRPIALIGFAAVAVMVLVARSGSTAHVLEVAVAAVPVALLAVLDQRPAPPDGRDRRHAARHLLRRLRVRARRAAAPAPHGNGVFLDVLVGTFVGDTGAYFGGRLFGRRPLAPTVSPNKTVEGLVCGMLRGDPRRLPRRPVPDVAESGTTRSCSEWRWRCSRPLGDLFESVIKRDAGAKDSGSVFGPHGGALDRLDGALFTVVVGYYIWLAVH